ncbi:MAG: hypothetical protein AABY05_02060 [Nanoarchaeota archaeon]
MSLANKLRKTGMAGLISIAGAGCEAPQANYNYTGTQQPPEQGSSEGEGLTLLGLGLWGLGVDNNAPGGAEFGREVFGAGLQRSNAEASRSQVIQTVNVNAPSGNFNGSLVNGTSRNSGLENIYLAYQNAPTVAVCKQIQSNPNGIRPEDFIGSLPRYGGVLRSNEPITITFLEDNLAMTDNVNIELVRINSGREELVERFRYTSPSPNNFRHPLNIGIFPLDERSKQPGEYVVRGFLGLENFYIGGGGKDVKFSIVP